MKNSLLLIIFILITSLSAIASEEKVCIVTGRGSTGIECNANDNDVIINPCTTVPYQASYTDVPVGYDFPYQYEWFVNNVSVKITTALGDNRLNWLIKSNPTDVYCKITYKNASSNTFTTLSTNTFKTVIKDLPFALQISGPTDVSCSANSVSYTLNSITCPSQFGDYCYSNPNAQYDITWVAPTGWVQTSSSNGGRNVTFTPNSNSGGSVIATIHLNRSTCDFTESRILNVTRSVTPPLFSTSNPSRVCLNTNNQRFNISGSCNAISYTFTIVGNPGILFTANNSQGLNTTNLYADLSFSGNSEEVTLKVKANYANSTSSSEVSTIITYGGFVVMDFDINSAPATYCYEALSLLDFQSFPVYQNKGYPVSYEWSYLQESTTQQTVVTPLPCSYSNCTASFSDEGIYQIRLLITDECGIQSGITKYISISYSCNGNRNSNVNDNNAGRISVSPNPARNNLYVTLHTSKQDVKPKKTGFRSIQMNLYDLYTSKIIRQWKFTDNQKQYQLNINGVRKGNYLLQVVDDNKKSVKQVTID